MRHCRPEAVDSAVDIDFRAVPADAESYGGIGHVHSPDGINVFGVGSGGMAIKSNDAGATWTTMARLAWMPGEGVEPSTTRV